MKKLTVEALPENMETVSAFAEEAFEEMGCPPKVTVQLLIAMDELFGNIVRYAYPQDKPGTAVIKISCVEEKRAVEIELVDSGVPFDPLAKEEPDVTLSIQERKIGGLGIFMVKKIVDEIAYEYHNGENHLRMRKLF